MFNLFRKKDEQIQKDNQVSTEYIDWRKRILSVQPTGNLKGIPDELYGLLMDVGMGNGRDQFLAISIYAFNTGEASLKASPGAGLIGLGDMEGVSGIPEKIVELGQSLVHLAKPTKNFDYAEANKVRFHFITTTGVRVYECGINELQPSHSFNEIFDMFSAIKSVADKFMDEINQKRNSPR